MRTRPRLGIAIAALACMGVLAPGSSAKRQGNAFPTLYVNYTMNCTFTMTDDSGQPVTAIPPGTYQIEVLTPVMFRLVDVQGRAANDFTGCKGWVQFQLNGPGVALQTTLDAGCATLALLPATAFQPGATYVAQDMNQPSVARFSFTTLTSGSPPVVTNPSGNGNGKGIGSVDVVGSGLAAKAKGTLAATLTSSGKSLLTTRGRTVSSLPPGLYRIVVTDEDGNGSFTLRKVGATTGKQLTGGPFVGKHSVTVRLSPGRWLYWSGAATPKTFVVS
jgi:hypothetical protein